MMISDSSPCWCAAHAMTHSQKDRVEETLLPSKPPPLCYSCLRPHIWKKNGTAEGFEQGQRSAFVLQGAPRVPSSAAVQLVDLGLHPIPFVVGFLPAAKFN